MNVAVALLETACDVLALEVQECFVSLADLLLETELPSKAFRQVCDVGLEILLGELLVLFWQCVHNCQSTLIPARQAHKQGT